MSSHTLHTPHGYSIITPDIVLSYLAHAAVVAGARGAVVHVALAVGAEPAVDAGALIPVDPIHADTVVVAGIRRALININLAVLACVT